MCPYTGSVRVAANPARSRRHRAVRAGFVIVVLLVVVTTLYASCFRPAGRAAMAEGNTILSADLGGRGPGSLVGAESMPNLISSIDDTGAQSARISYRSSDGDTGAETVVSGTVFVPGGKPPAGGWPTVAYGHGATGIDPSCGPSSYNDLLGQSAPVVELLDRGYAVAFPDYQGLGAEGIHPFTDARTAGLNMIDAVRALRATFPGVSKRWAAYGGSLGGGAAWAANEQAAAYAPELEFVGSVAISPAVDVTGVVAKAADGELTLEQAGVLQWLLVSLNRLHPEVNLDDFRRGTASASWQSLSACAFSADRSDALDALNPDDLGPHTPAAAAQLRELLQRWALPQRPLSGPLSVVYGDNDAYLDHEWTTQAVQRACASGGMVNSRLESGKGHLDVDASDQAQWLEDRFAGKAVSRDC